MNKIIDEIFRNKSVVLKKLQHYGFKREGDRYVLTKYIADSQMSMTVYIGADLEVSTKVTDIDTMEEYALFLTDEADGSFVNQVRSEYRQILSDIAQKCSQKQIFKSPQAQAVIEYIRDKYGDELEFLWEKFDDNAVWRRKDNKKWYGLIVVVKRSKLGIDGDGDVETLVLRATADDVEKLVDNKKYLKAYHMNKNNWISICLDGTCSNEEIEERLDISYCLALKK